MMRRLAALLLAFCVTLAAQAPLAAAACGMGGAAAMGDARACCCGGSGSCCAAPAAIATCGDGHQPAQAPAPQAAPAGPALDLALERLAAADAAVPSLGRSAPDAPAAPGFAASTSDLRRHLRLAVLRD